MDLVKLHEERKEYLLNNISDEKIRERQERLNLSDFSYEDLMDGYYPLDSISVDNNIDMQNGIMDSLRNVEDAYDMIYETVIENEDEMIDDIDEDEYYVDPFENMITMSDLIYDTEYVLRHFDDGKIHDKYPNFAMDCELYGLYSDVIYDALEN